MEPRRSIRGLIALRQVVFLQAVALCWLQATPNRSFGAEAEAAVVLRGVNGKPIRLTRADLKALPRAQTEAIDRRGHKSQYEGVALRTLLDKLKVPRGEALRGEWMRAFVVVEANDDYRVIFALPELDPGFTDRVILLADTSDGQPLEKYKGPFRVIVPGEKRPTRWVRMVKEIRIIDSRALGKP
jgi:hypothetical protein